MADLSRRLQHLERGTALKQANRQRAARVALARLMAAEGDPRTRPDFASESPAVQARVAWLYDVWKDDPQGFIDGWADERFYPEPPPVGDAEGREAAIDELIAGAAEAEADRDR